MSVFCSIFQYYYDVKETCQICCFESEGKESNILVDRAKDASYKNEKTIIVLLISNRLQEKIYSRRAMLVMFALILIILQLALMEIRMIKYFYDMYLIIDKT